MNAPYKLTPIHHWHLRHGGKLSQLNGWMRVTSYRDLISELDAARERVGLCDVTPISKIDVQGRHASEALTRACGCKMPGPGRCTSGPMPNAELTDAYTIQLTSERFLILSMPAQRERLCQRFVSVANEYGCVHVTDMTSAYAAIRMVGPMSVTLLKKLGPARVDAMPPDDCMQTGIARVASVLVRRDIGKYLGWVLLIPRDYGEYVWECIVEAGQEFGLSPFGTSAEQALLREEASSVAVV